MNIIDHLSKTVTPKVLSDANASSETSMLEQFYAIFLARLADDNTYAKLGDGKLTATNAGLDAIVWNDTKDPQHVAEQLATNHGLEVDSVKQMMAASSPLVVEEVESLAGDKPVPTYLRELQKNEANNNAGFVDYIPNWALALLPAGLLGGAAATTTSAPVEEPAAQVAPEPAGTRISDTMSTAPLSKTEEPSGSFMKALLPIIGLIILGALAWALLKGCQEPATTAPVVATQQPVESVVAVTDTVDQQPSVLRLSVDESGETVYAATAAAGDQSVIDTMKSAIATVFGQPSADKLMVDIDQNLTTQMAAGEYLAEILNLVKGVPSASISILGETIRVNAPDTAARDKLVNDLQNLLPPQFTVEAEPDLNVGESVTQSITDSQAALNRLTSNPDLNDLIRALNLQIINFEVDEAIIPEENKVILDRAAEIFKSLSGPRLKITGHTDSQASDAYNQELSERRAAAVKDYLVSQGVDADRLTTIGAGENQPIADNSTEQGRFRNRRIEFGVMSDGEAVAVIGNGEPTATLPIADVADSASAAVNGATQAVNAAGNAVREAASDVVNFDPDLNPTDANNDDILPDSDDQLQ